MGTIATRFTHAVALASARATGQDRAAVFARASGVVIALADGAGGTSHGARAAQALVDAVGAAVGEALDASALIETVDRVSEGQTTAIVLAVDADGIAGSSVGDSGAWLVGDEVVELTEGQLRKPLVGGGGVPVAFATGPIGSATVLVASDGLFRYASPTDIARIARGPDLDAAARALIALVRLPSGGLQDDVTVVLCRAVGA